ncbi:MAG: hypothetical protein ACFBSG_07710 [Leptolyngbyaceae cyanobacterium]
MDNLQRSLTPELIRQLLHQEARADRSADYVRLMEIYCVVKAGGIKAQIAAAQHLKATECRALQEEITALSATADKTNRIAALHQEIQEVERSTAHRIAYLNNINEVEAANVHSCIALIEAYFARLGQTHECNSKD